MNSLRHYRSVKFLRKSDSSQQHINEFHNIEISGEFQKAINDVFNYKTMTDVQRSSISQCLESHNDTIIKAQTGTGKTLAYLIVALEKLVQARKEYYIQMNSNPYDAHNPNNELNDVINTGKQVSVDNQTIQSSNKNDIDMNAPVQNDIIKTLTTFTTIEMPHHPKPMILILAPNQDMVIQIAKEAKLLCSYTDMKIISLYCGASMTEQCQEIYSHFRTTSMKTITNKIDNAHIGIIDKVTSQEEENPFSDTSSNHTHDSSISNSNHMSSSSGSNTDSISSNYTMNTEHDTSISQDNTTIFNPHHNSITTNQNMTDIHKTSSNYGPDVIIATPIRFLRHLQSTTYMHEICANIQVLVIDEADRLLSYDLIKCMKKIMILLNQYQVSTTIRQTLCYSATYDKEFKQIIDGFLENNNYDVIDTVGYENEPTNASVDQYMMAIPSSDMVTILSNILEHEMQRNSQSKIIVYFPVSQYLIYLAELYISIGYKNIYQVHSKQSKRSNTKASEHFHDCSHGILFSTDSTARGRNFPYVTLIIQIGYTHLEQYIHRLGRTARAGRLGEGLILCIKEEKKMIDQEILRQVSYQEIISIQDFFNRIPQHLQIPLSDYTADSLDSSSSSSSSASVFQTTTKSTQMSEISENQSIKITDIINTNPESRSTTSIIDNEMMSDDSSITITNPMISTDITTTTTVTHSFVLTGKLRKQLVGDKLSSDMKIKAREAFIGWLSYYSLFMKRLDCKTAQDFYQLCHHVACSLGLIGIPPLPGHILSCYGWTDLPGIQCSDKHMKTQSEKYDPNTNNNNYNNSSSSILNTEENVHVHVSNSHQPKPFKHYDSNNNKSSLPSSFTPATTATATAGKRNQCKNNYSRNEYSRNNYDNRNYNRNRSNYGNNNNSSSSYGSDSRSGGSSNSSNRMERSSQNKSSYSKKPNSYQSQSATNTFGSNNKKYN